jgi:hypothetical protein
MPSCSTPGPEARKLVCINLFWVSTNSFLVRFFNELCYFGLNFFEDHRFFNFHGLSFLYRGFD